MQLTEHKIKKTIPLDMNCFATHDNPSEGVGLRMYITDDNYTVGLCKTKKCHQGYENTIHGGIISTYFDEVLWYATTIDNEDLAMTVELTVRYLAALPVDEEIRIIAKPMVKNGRHINVDGYILNEKDEIVAEASGHFITVRDDHEINESELQEVMYVPDTDHPETIAFYVDDKDL